MQSENIGKVNRKQFEEILPFLRWKERANQLRIDENQIAKYRNLSIREARTVLMDLQKNNIVITDIVANCPQCMCSQTIENEYQNITCLECENEFIPADRKDLLHEYLILNTKNRLLRNEQVSMGELISMTGAETILRKKKVFLSYSHVDETYKVELDKHFAALRRSDKVETWNDRKLEAGCKLDEEIKTHLNEADIIILLISADFIHSNYCYEIEMERAIQRANNGECKLVPVIIRPCLWTETPIKDFLALPKDGQPISKYDDKDEAYLEITKAIRDMID